jgi:hypothetical protein
MFLTLQHQHPFHSLRVKLKDCVAQYKHMDGNRLCIHAKTGTARSSKCLQMISKCLQMVETADLRELQMDAHTCTTTVTARRLTDRLLLTAWLFQTRPVCATRTSDALHMRRMCTLCNLLATATEAGTAPVCMSMRQCARLYLCFES